MSAAAAQVDPLASIKVPLSLSLDEDIYQWLVAFVEQGGNSFIPTIDDALTLAVRAMMEPGHPKD